MSDLFQEELTSAQQEEIEKLRSQIAELKRDCQKLNMIYRQAWEIAAKTCCDGSLLLIADEKPFTDLYGAMANYDNNNDLRDKYTDLVSDWT